jgi:hypothetical protein
MHQDRIACCHHTGWSLPCPQNLSVLLYVQVRDGVTSNPDKDKLTFLASQVRGDLGVAKVEH